MTEDIVARLRGTIPSIYDARDAADEIERLRAELAAANARGQKSKVAAIQRAKAAKARERELRDEVVCFLALWADEYQRMNKLDGLHPQHYDRLKELGARMDSFKRANIAALNGDDNAV